MKILLLLLATLLTVKAQDAAPLVITHNDQAYCQRIAWLPGAPPFCKQSVWVFSASNAPLTTAVKFTMDYQDKTGERRSASQIVRAENGNALALFYDFPDIKILRILAEPLATTGKSTTQEF